MDPLAPIVDNGNSTCAFCIRNLLRHERLPSFDDEEEEPCNSLLDYDEDDDDVGYCQEIGAVVPCGHVFHVDCWRDWSGHQCPSCRTPATTFIKLYISAPPLPPSPPARPVAPPTPTPEEELSLTETEYEEIDENSTSKKEDNDNYKLVLDEDEEDEEQRQVLLDMRTAEQEGAARAIQKVVSLKAKMRKMKRSSAATKSELASTKLVLQFTQDELELANNEIENKKVKMEEMRAKVERLVHCHWARHQIVHDDLVRRHNEQLHNLRLQLEHAQSHVAVRNHQLTHWMAAAREERRQQNAYPPQQISQIPVVEASHKTL